MLRRSRTPTDPTLSKWYVHPLVSLCDRTDSLLAACARNCRSLIGIALFLPFPDLILLFPYSVLAISVRLDQKKCNAMYSSTRTTRSDRCRSLNIDASFRHHVYSRLCSFDSSSILAFKLQWKLGCWPAKDPAQESKLQSPRPNKISKTVCPCLSEGNAPSCWSLVSDHPIAQSSLQAPPPSLPAQCQARPRFPVRPRLCHEPCGTQSIGAAEADRSTRGACPAVSVKSLVQSTIHTGLARSFCQ